MKGAFLVCIRQSASSHPSASIGEFTFGVRGFTTAGYYYSFDNPDSFYGYLQQTAFRDNPRFQSSRPQCPTMGIPPRTQASERTALTWNFDTQRTGVVLPSGTRVTMAYTADFFRVTKEA